MSGAAVRSDEAQAALRRAAGAAILAPSVHNTQPWRLRIRGRTLEVHADRARQLASLDPTGRLLAVSCGCAVASAEIRLRADGWDPVVTMLPDGPGDHLADLECGDADPGVTAEERALGDAIERRHSQRHPFVDGHLSVPAVERLRAAARAAGAWFRPLRDDGERRAFTSLLDDADWEQRTDPAYREELQAWVRTDPAPDGVPLAALAATDVHHDDVLLREFDLDSPAAARRRHRPGPPVTDRATLALLGTERDRETDWLTAGRALGRILLMLTVDDLQASVLGQVVDLPRARRLLQARLGVPGPVQVALRIGRGPDVTPTPRRELGDVLTVKEVSSEEPQAGP